MKPIQLATAIVACSMLVFSSNANGQSFLGQPTLPLPTDSVSPLSFHGNYMEMDGGYAIGDTVSDFQIYNLAGESLKLSDLYAGEKPIVLSSVSASCIRFTTCFNESATEFQYADALDFMQETSDDVEWIFVYGPEAHPGDLENCTSNCPPITITAPNGDTLFQHQTYQDRIDAVELWHEIVESDTLTHVWEWPLYLDNPDNLVYDNFFARPFGNLVVNCEGVVIGRGDWTSHWLTTEGGIEFMESFLEEGFQQCGYPSMCNDDPTDTDGDGFCDVVEEFNGSDPNDVCDPDNTDSDGDGICDNQEIIDGTDPFFNENPTQIGEFGQQQVRVYPSPVNTLLHIESSSEVRTAIVQDMTGKTVLESTPTDGVINCDALATGVYYLRLVFDSGIQTMRIVKN